MRLDISYVISAVTAILAGAAIAAGGVLQQRAASRRPSRERLSPRLMARLVRDRTWLAGIGLAVLSYGFQAVALKLGPLALVQPLIVCELLFAVPLSVRLRGLRLRPRDWLAAGLVVAGLAVGILAAFPGKGQSLQPFLRWLPALIAVAVLAGAAVLLARRIQGPVKASLFGFAGAVLMALQSALYAATIHVLTGQGWRVVTHWETYALIVVSILGAFLIQNAFQSGPLAASSPVIDATLPVAAIVLGVWLFGEQVRTSALGLAGGIGGIALLLAGIIALDTSPVVRHEHRIERQEQKETASREAAAAAGD